MYKWEGTEAEGLAALKAFCEKHKRIPRRRTLSQKRRGNKEAVEGENKVASFMSALRKKTLLEHQHKKQQESRDSVKSDSGVEGVINTVGSDDEDSTGALGEEGIPKLVLDQWTKSFGRNTASQRKFANLWAVLESIDQGTSMSAFVSRRL